MDAVLEKDNFMTPPLCNCLVYEDAIADPLGAGNANPSGLDQSAWPPNLLEPWTGSMAVVQPHQVRRLDLSGTSVGPYFSCPFLKYSQMSTTLTEHFPRGSRSKVVFLISGMT